MSFGELLWLAVLALALQPVLRLRLLEGARRRLRRRIERERGSRVILLVHRQDTLIGLAADRIVMCEHAVLGPIDPQIAEYPAASILRAVERKEAKDTEDETLILADQAQMRSRSFASATPTSSATASRPRPPSGSPRRGPTATGRTTTRSRRRKPRRWAWTSTCACRRRSRT
ncbi:MAG TPA: hypothetical protein VF216_04900 [Mizugakiibacter sp.]